MPDPKKKEPSVQDVWQGPPQRWAKPGPYTTVLPPEQEKAFQQWVVDTHQNVAPPGEEGDYDDRGFYQALMDPHHPLHERAKQSISEFDGTVHGPDTWKQPNHPTFSNESIYATPDAPRWQGMRLVDKTGRVISDESVPVPHFDKPLDTMGLARYYTDIQLADQADKQKRHEAYMEDLRRVGEMGGLTGAAKARATTERPKRWYETIFQPELQEPEPPAKSEKSEEDKRKQSYLKSNSASTHA